MMSSSPAELDSVGYLFQKGCAVKSISLNLSWVLLTIVSTVVLSHLGTQETLVWSQETKPISKITFGSCARENKPQPIWDSIADEKSDLFLFIGDCIYGDTQDMDILQKKWNLLGAKPGYQRLKKSCPILATWDDHEYGVNDGGAEYPKKVQSQKVFLDFFDEPLDSVRRKTPGVYDAKMFGPKGKRVQVILLDTRFFRSKLVKSQIRHNSADRNDVLGINGPYAPNQDSAATVLGKAQWKWLEQELRKPAEIRIIASSIQLIANDHWWEKWGNFPHERKRMLDLISKTKANGVVFISGDRHTAEVSKLEGDWNYPLFDVTSSSLNQPHKWKNEINHLRLGSLYCEENYGRIRIDWTKGNPTVSLEIINIQGKPVIEVRTSVNELQGQAK